jgi:hypothetical protein
MLLYTALSVTKCAPTVHCIWPLFKLVQVPVSTSLSTLALQLFRAMDTTARSNPLDCRLASTLAPWSPICGTSKHIRDNPKRSTQEARPRFPKELRYLVVVEVKLPQVSTDCSESIGYGNCSTSRVRSQRRTCGATALARNRATNRCDEGGHARQSTAKAPLCRVFRFHPNAAP